MVNGNTPATEDEAVAQPPTKNKKKKRVAAGSAVELFNLVEDPYERNDLSAAHPEKANELRARYDLLAKQASPPKNLRP